MNKKSLVLSAAAAISGEKSSVGSLLGSAGQHSRRPSSMQPPQGGPHSRDTMASSLTRRPSSGGALSSKGGDTPKDEVGGGSFKFGTSPGAKSNPLSGPGADDNDDDWLDNVCVSIHIGDEDSSKGEATPTSTGGPSPAPGFDEATSAKKKTTKPAAGKKKTTAKGGKNVVG